MLIFKHTRDNINTDSRSIKTSSKSVEDVKTSKSVSPNSKKTKLSQINRNFLEELGFELKK